MRKNRKGGRSRGKIGKALRVIAVAKRPREDAKKDRIRHEENVMKAGI